MKAALFFAILVSSVVALQQDSKPRLPYGSGNDYLTVCGPVDEKQDLSSTELKDFIACVSYLKGIHDGVEEATDKKPYCAPGEVTYHQAGRVLVKYMRENPARLHLPVATLYIMAMKDAFACK